MAIMNKTAVTPQEKRQAENVVAQIEKLAANQDYIAMMADIDLEEEESEVSEDEQ